MTSSLGPLPNILYIFSDQHAARVMGCAGDSAADTPNLDRLAREGAHFTRAYCPSPVCLPSRMSMLTGQRPHEQTCWTNDDILDSARPTWLHGLGAHGYQPTLIGRMHSLGPDQMRGYVDRPIGDHSPNWPGVARRGMGELSGTSGPFSQSISKSGPGQSSYHVMDSDVAKASVEFLKKYASSGSKQPFCLTASFMLPHPPYVASTEDFEAVKDRVPEPALPTPTDGEHPWIKRWREIKGVSDVSAEDVHRARSSYYGLVRQFDRYVGQLLDTLDDTGAAENTLVVYVSDHGDHIGERGLFWKHTFYEESVNVPLILRWPGQVDADVEIATPVETGALGNTILSLVGSQTLPNASMKSFAPLLTGDKGYKVSPIFIEYCTDDLPAWTEGCALQQRAVILGDCKLVYYHGYLIQLFDLKSDPMELADLSTDPEHQTTVEALTLLVLDEWNPESIRQIIERRKTDKLMLKAWAEKIAPRDQHRWDLKADQSFLLANK